MVANAPKRVNAPSWVDRPQVIAAEGTRRKRVALLSGCAQQVLRPEINEATVRLLTRHGCEVVIAEGAGCCGAVFHQLGLEARAKAAAKANIAAWWRAIEDGGLDAIVFNASGCGVALKDYEHLLRDDPEWAERAARVSSMCHYVSEILVDVGLKPAVVETGQAVTYHLACTMQHGLGLRTPAKALMTQVGFVVREPAEAHICCGSAGPLLDPSAGHFGEAAPAQAGEHRSDAPRDCRFRQYRLHHPSRRGNGSAGRAHGGAAGLGDGRAETRCPGCRLGHELINGFRCVAKCDLSSWEELIMSTAPLRADAISSGRSSSRCCRTSRAACRAPMIARC